MTMQQNKPSSARVSDETGGVAAENALATGVVKALVTDSIMLVGTEDIEQIEAIRAAGCLLSPAIGDTVALFIAGGNAHILSVLERSAEYPAQISVPGADDVEVTAANLKLHGKAQVVVQSPVIAISARRLNTIVETASQTAQKFILNAARMIESVSDKMTSAGTMTTTVQTRTTKVKGVDTHDAGSLIQKVEDVASHRSDVTLMTAKNDVRIEAERVSVS
ncbi:DUF3540 domain-containing protein [uncultured Roseibium sp.]|uniref:DUF3540 domain-containing protein n=1 Tax=uncultured Roseibium sp. TaxID=1936171 RepID=UPI00260AEDA1|nr:DUF3540 domain-containing protein [uncultured Roseibium sp.]